MKTCENKYTFIQHQRDLSRTRRYIYSACGKSFSKRYRLNHHWRVHTGTRALMSVWNVVNYLASRPASFSTTQFTLGKGLMYAGNVGTSLLTDLFHYLRFHTESRPFECGECGKPFRWRSVAPAVLESSHWITALWMTAQVEDLAHWVSENSHRKFRELTSMCGESASSVVLITQQVSLMRVLSTWI